MRLEDRMSGRAGSEPLKNAYKIAESLRCPDSSLLLLDLRNYKFSESDWKALLSPLFNKSCKVEIVRFEGANLTDRVINFLTEVVRSRIQDSWPWLTFRLDDTLPQAT